MATRPRPSPYVEGGPNKFESFMNQLLGQTPNYAGYQPVYEDHVQQYEIDAGEAQPIDYVRQEYGTPPTGPDLEASAPGADPALQARIDAGEFEDDLWEGTAGELGMGAPAPTAPTAPVNGSGQVTIENQNRMNENQAAMRRDLDQEDTDMMQLLGKHFGPSQWAGQEAITRIPNKQLGTDFRQAPSDRNPEGEVPRWRQIQLQNELNAPGPTGPQPAPQEKPWHQYDLLGAIGNWFSGNKGRTITPPMATTGDIRNRPMSIGASSSAPQFTAQGHRMAGLGGSDTGPASDSARHTHQPKFTPAT